MSENSGSTGNKDTVSVLLAPTWGKNGILNRYGERIIDALVATGFELTIRPHPQSMISDPEVVESLMNRYQNTGTLHWDFASDNFESLRGADVLVSDYSGILYDFAFVFERPVIYTEPSIDLDVTDHCWIDDRLSTYDLLTRIGKELREEDFDTLGDTITGLLEDQSFKQGIMEARDLYWKNRGHASELVVDYLLKKNDELRMRNPSDEPKSSLANER